MAQEKGESAVRYRGLLDALVRIPREEGLLALWRGLLPRLMRIPPGQARALPASQGCGGRGRPPNVGKSKQTPSIEHCLACQMHLRPMQICSAQFVIPLEMCGGPAAACCRRCHQAVRRRCERCWSSA